MGLLNLGGDWSVTIKGNNYTFKLPGSACDNQLGDKKEYYKEYSKEAVRTAIEKYEYIGELALTKEIEIPQEVQGKCIKLFMERVNVSSKLFLDGVQVCRQLIGLSTPHIYDLTGKLTPGRHHFKIVLDNSDLVNLSNMASGYSADTQGFWNGIIGRFELQWEDECHIEDIQVYPKADGSVDLKLSLHSDEKTPAQHKPARIHIIGKTPKGDRRKEKVVDVKLFATLNYWYADYDMRDLDGGIQWWDEFCPELYTLIVRLEYEGEIVHEKQLRFGMRTVSVEGQSIYINGKRRSFRGNVDCAQFPKTGYPPMDRAVWEHNLGATKEWGLNLVRFHGWCPPEVAFEVADELGLYLQVEMPLWLNKDVTPIQLGDDSVHERFFTSEAVKILRTYGNHPSFVFFSNGNENMGDYRILEDITRVCKAMDNRHLYAITSNFDHPVGPVEDYFLAQDANGYPIRIQHLHEKVAEASDVNFDEAARSMPIPFMNFEVGQYGVYPDVDIIEKYDGNMLPVNYDVIKKEMLKAGVYDRRREYIKASGDLCYRLYKEDVEAVYRTRAMSGYQLLCIQDYSGQDTATVGMLDVMYMDKGVVDRKIWREFVGPVVPLFEAGRIFSNKDILKAKLGLYDYGEEPIENPVYKIKLTEITNLSETILLEREQSEEDFQFDLSVIEGAARLNVELEVDNHINHWNLFVYPQKEPSEVEIRVEKRVENPVSSGYIPVFWSPVMFETDKPSGAIINNNHKLFEDFPTEQYPDYQWKKLLDNAVAIDIRELDFEPEPLVELVPNFDCNKTSMVLFEGLYENEKALYCGLDLEGKDQPTQHLKNCICQYVKSNKLVFVQLTK